MDGPIISSNTKIASYKKRTLTTGRTHWLPAQLTKTPKFESSGACTTSIQISRQIKQVTISFIIQITSKQADTSHLPGTSSYRHLPKSWIKGQEWSRSQPCLEQKYCIPPKKYYMNLRKFAINLLCAILLRLLTRPGPCGEARTHIKAALMQYLEYIILFNMATQTHCGLHKYSLLDISHAALVGKRHTSTRKVQLEEQSDGASNRLWHHNSKNQILTSSPPWNMPGIECKDWAWEYIVN